MMVLAQGLGQLHRLAHGPLPPTAAATATVVDPASGVEAHDAAHDHHAAGSGWLQALFAADEHAAACVLYDQLAHADGLTSLPLLSLPPAWVAAVPPWHGVWQLAAQATGYLARGPPALG